MKESHEVMMDNINAYEALPKPRPFTPSGLHNDEGKPRWDLLPYDSLNEVVKVLTYGEKKYPLPPRNWELGIKYSKIYASLMRHAWKWFLSKITGQPGLDPESGLSHMAHLVCNGLFLLTYELRKMEEFDDRPTSTGQ